VLLGHVANLGPTWINNKPRDVVSAPSVGAGTTHEVHLRKTRKNLVMWSQHRQSVLVPLTSFAYETKKTRDVVWAPAVSAGTTYEVCLQNKKNLAMWFEHRLSVLVPLTRFAYETKINLVMWYEHRQSVLVPLTRFAYDTKKKLVMWYEHWLSCWYHLRGSFTKPKKTRDVVWAPSVGAGTTYEVHLRNKYKKPRGVTKFAYDTKKIHRRKVSAPAS
jgi:hypothetical protein